MRARAPSSSARTAASVAVCPKRAVQICPRALRSTSSTEGRGPGAFAISSRSEKRRAPSRRDLLAVLRPGGQAKSRDVVRQRRRHSMGASSRHSDGFASIPRQFGRPTISPLRFLLEPAVVVAADRGRSADIHRRRVARATRDILTACRGRQMWTISRTCPGAVSALRNAVYKQTVSRLAFRPKESHIRRRRTRYGARTRQHLRADTVKHSIA